MARPWKAKPGQRVWLVLDAHTVRKRGTGDATVLVSCDSEAEAREYTRDTFPDGVIYVYDLVNVGKDYPEARNERLVT